MRSPASRSDQNYPSDLSRAQFEVIRPLLESARKRTSPRHSDLFHIFNAVLYLLREGCRWRSLPRDYPDWRLCYYYYRVWRDHTDPQSGLPLLELVLKKTGLKRPEVCWKGRGNHLSDHRRPKREEHQSGRKERL